VLSSRGVSRIRSIFGIYLFHDTLGDITIFTLLPPSCEGKCTPRKCPRSIPLHPVHSWRSSAPFNYIMFLCRWHGDSFDKRNSPYRLR
jgi:hypothetical protein